MAYNQPNFWDFVRTYDQNNYNNNGAGVDHPAPGSFNFFGPPGPQRYHSAGQGPFGAAFAFNGAGPFGPRGFGSWSHGQHHGHGHRGRHGRHGDNVPREPESGEEGAAGVAQADGHGVQTDGEGTTREGGGREGEPRCGPRGNRCGPGMYRGGRGHRGCRPRGPHPGFGGFDMSELMEGLAEHPLAQAFRSFMDGQGQGQRAAETEDDNTFTPPVDIFTTETAYVIHIALPGAKKEDVGVNWDAEKGMLNIAGVVYRHGDEQFLKTLSKGERKVGVFERAIKLPPVSVDEEKEEVDSDAITAKLEDGVLVVTVPKVEREWTEIKRVDIE